MNQQVRARRMLAWLTFLPPLDKIARALVLDYFLPYQPIEAAIWHLSGRDALTCLAMYGRSQALVGVTLPTTVWRSSSEVQALANQSAAKQSSAWSEGGRYAVVNLYSQSALIGFLTVRFAQAGRNQERLSQELEDFAQIIALYISLRFLENIRNDQLKSDEDLSAHNGKISLTERQRAVLAGIVMRQTNLAIAKDLGYSVSTIRHETMRIFETLGVSNRLDAASVATTLGLV